jgi:RND family efflux transporter MFP subunit
MKSIKTTFTMLILAGATALITSCGDDSASLNESKVKVEVRTISLSTVNERFDFSGSVKGVESVKLSTKLMGEITYLPFEAGSEIIKGQVLVKIRSTDLLAKKQQVVANLAQANAHLKNMEINYNRIKSLFEKNSATKKEMEDIQMAYDMAAAQVNAVKEMETEINDVLSYAVIKAPFNGFIVNKFYEEGDLTAPGHPILIVENFDQFEVAGSIPASEVNRFQKGGMVKIVVDAIEDHVFTGKVIEINPGANPASRQFTVQVIINKDSKYSELKSGLYARLIFENDGKDIITVDENELVRRGQLTGVYTINNQSEASLQWIRLGKKDGSRYEVLSGLSEGDKVITNPDLVIDGKKVEVL